MDRSLLKVISITPALLGILNNSGYLLIVKFKRAKKEFGERSSHDLSIKSAL